LLNTSCKTNNADLPEKNILRCHFPYI